MFGDQEAVPGVDQGSFAVVGSLASNTCGDGAFSVVDPFEFDMQLSKADSKLYWSKGSDYIEGTIASNGTTFSISSSVAVQYSTSCALQRKDSLKGTLVVKNDKIVSYTGTLTYSFSQVQGSRCDAVLAEQSVTQIPCSIQYSVSATPK